MGTYSSKASHQVVVLWSVCGSGCNHSSVDYDDVLRYDWYASPSPTYLHTCTWKPASSSDRRVKWLHFPFRSPFIHILSQPVTIHLPLMLLWLTHRSTWAWCAIPPHALHGLIPCSVAAQLGMQFCVSKSPGCVATAAAPKASSSSADGRINGS